MGAGGQWLCSNGEGHDPNEDDSSKAVVYIDPEALRPFYLKDKVGAKWELIEQFDYLKITKVMLKTMSVEELDVVIKLLYLQRVSMQENKEKPVAIEGVEIINVECKEAVLTNGKEPEKKT